MTMLNAKNSGSSRDKDKARSPQDSTQLDIFQTPFSLMFLQQ